MSYRTKSSLCCKIAYCLLLIAYCLLLIADKGLIRPELNEDLLKKDINLQTPLCSNMEDNRPKSFVKKLVTVAETMEALYRTQDS